MSRTEKGNAIVQNRRPTKLRAWVWWGSYVAKSTVVCPIASDPSQTSCAAAENSGTDESCRSLALVQQLSMNWDRYALCNGMLLDSLEVVCGFMFPVIVDICKGANCRRLTAVIIWKDLMPDRLSQEQQKNIWSVTEWFVVVAKIGVDMPFYKGRIKAICVHTLLYNLISDNVLGIFV